MPSRTIDPRGSRAIGHTAHLRNTHESEEIIMDMKSFMESSWVRQARDPQTVTRVIEELPQWVQKVQNSELVARALRLWEYLTSGQCSWAEVAMVAGALLVPHLAD